MECNICSPVSGVYLGMSCPVCERPFRNVRMALTADEMRNRVIIDISVKTELIESEAEYLAIINKANENT